MKNIQTQLKYTCNRCKTELVVDVPPLPPLRKEALELALETFDEEEDFFEAHCSNIGSTALSKAGWSCVNFTEHAGIGRISANYDLCPQCSADAAVFLSDIESFANQEESKCRLFDDYCIEHEFTHGAEATELREGIEQILRDLPGLDQANESFTVPIGYLQRLLDRIDARDSLAYAEHLEKEKSAQNIAQEKTAPKGQTED